MSTSTTPSLQATIGELVTQRPSRSRIFEQFGLDYCCGGKKPLDEACAAKGLDAQAVLARLLEADANAPEDAGEDWSRASLTSLADHIEQTHHAYLKRELPRLAAMVRKVAAVHGDRHPWMRDVDEVYTGFAVEMQSHMMKEERVLFPMIRGLESDSAQHKAGHDSGPGLTNPVRVMEHEHEHSGQALAQMRSLTSDFTPPLDACNTFRATLDGLRELEADTHRHVHRENNILFPRAVAAEQASSPTT